MANNTGKKSGGCLGCLTLLALVAGVGAYAYFNYFKFFTEKELVIQEAAKTVPEKAVMVSFIKTDDQSWSKLAKFQTPSTENLIKELQLGSSTQNQINYQQDIQPWLGNILLAFLPTGNPKESDLNLLMIVGIKDKNKALEFIQKIKSQSPQNVKDSQYEGISLSEITVDNKQTLTYAFVDSQLLISSERATIEAAINTKNGQPSLGQKAGSNEIFSQKLNLVNPIIQTYFIDYTGLEKNNISADTLKRSQQIISMVAGVGIEDQGLHFQAVAKLDPTVNKPILQINKNKLLSQFPPETLIFVNGQGIGQWWSQLVNQSQNLPSVKSFVDESREFVKNTTNLDLDRDILNWMNGEFALGIIPTDSGVFGSLGMSSILMFETSDRFTASNTLDNLKNRIPPFIQPQQSAIKGISVNEWKTIQGQTAFSYGWSNNNLLLLSLGSSLTNVISIQPQNSLAQSPDFQRITASLPKQNNGYFYLNFSQGISAIKKSNGILGQNLKTETEENLNSIIGIAATSTMPDSETTQLDLMVALKAK